MNVAAEDLPEAYREVAASLYSPEAIHYRMLHGVAGDSAEMAVGVIAMQDATASGVVFSRDPSAPDSGEVLIQSVHGLGVSLVDGRTSPEVIRVAREGDPPRLTRTASRQASRFVALPGSGIKEDALDPAAAAIPCITDEEALQLARWALELEAHFGCPQDIEWSVTPDRRLVLLQSRPLRVLRQAARQAARAGFHAAARGRRDRLPGGGLPARRCTWTADGEIEAFPAGGVLVARRSSPSLVRVMSKARAIVTDAGSTTGHMASLARELRIPTLLNTGTATRAIAAGTLVTVDAGNGHVYAGEVRAALERQAAVAEVETGRHRAPPHARAPLPGAGTRADRAAQPERPPGADLHGRELPDAARPRALHPREVLRRDVRPRQGDGRPALRELPAGRLPADRPLHHRPGRRHQGPAQGPHGEARATWSRCP